VRDIGGIWELIPWRPDTLGEVLVLETAPASAFRFPDDLWARIVYEFALGHHYAVVYREQLLRSLVPLYLGRTAAYVQATRTATAEPHRAGAGRGGPRLRATEALSRGTLALTMPPARKTRLTRPEGTRRARPDAHDGRAAGRPAARPPICAAPW